MLPWYSKVQIEGSHLAVTNKELTIYAQTTANLTSDFSRMLHPKTKRNLHMGTIFSARIALIMTCFYVG